MNIILLFKEPEPGAGAGFWNLPGAGAGKSKKDRLRQRCKKPWLPNSTGTYFFLQVRYMENDDVYRTEDMMDFQVKNIVGAKFYRYGQVIWQWSWCPDIFGSTVAESGIY